MHSYKHSVIYQERQMRPGGKKWDQLAKMGSGGKNGTRRQQQGGREGETRLRLACWRLLPPGLWSQKVGLRPGKQNIDSMLHFSVRFLNFDFMSKIVITVFTRINAYAINN
jgi:hypothetical protein